MKRLQISLIMLFFIMPSIAMAADINLKFGIYGSEVRTSLDKQFKPILNAVAANMSKSLGKSVEIKTSFFKSYDAGVEALIMGKVDFSRVGAASYVAAKKKNADLSILAIETKKGKKTFNGVICVHKKSKIQKVEDLKGKTFAFGNKQSTIGRYLSQLYLYEHGIKAADFSKYDYLGQHDKVATSVFRKKYDAGAFKNGILKKAALAKKLRVIAKFPNVTQPWVGRKGLSPEISEHLTKALLAIKNKKLLKKLKRDGFLAGTDADYAQIRKSIEQNDLFFK